MKKWETKDGKEIPYSKLEDSHLLNILKWIEKRAVGGVTITEGWCDWDGMPDYGESYDIFGDEVREHYDYKGLKREAKKRKLL